MYYQFNRQKPLNNYIVDFYCKPLNLVIEVDGSYHNQPEQRVKDEERQKILETMGLNFLRFSEMEVRKDMELVLKTIENYILDYEAKHPGIKQRPSRYRKRFHSQCMNPPYTISDKGLLQLPPFKKRGAREPRL